MRRINWRFVVTGIVLAILAAGFFLFMLSIAGKSNDPASMMRTVGQVSGVAGALGIVLAVLGLIGKKFPS
jgi:hypothetical protein